MILNHAFDILDCGVFANISSMFSPDVGVFLKLEAFNAAGSIKLKPAIALVEALEKMSKLRTGRTIIDTTSGNMGIALAIVAKSKGYGFVCVTDEKMTVHNRAIVKAYDAEIVVMPNSTLDERYRYIEARIAADNSLVWTRQFTNPENPATHARTTAREILSEFERIDYLFVGTGTGGTLAGCSKAFAEQSPDTKIFAVDAAGSLHFEEPKPWIQRRIPGIGATRRSPFLLDVHIHKALVVGDRETIRTCCDLRDATGWLVGGSTGSVVAAARSMQRLFSRGATVVCVGADMGERYLNTIYNEDWVRDEFGDLDDMQNDPPPDQIAV
ncbi:pyridoxal-phosphate dependent enzyme [Bradyrhizobium sp. 188]|uniref:pyridoxal-phosphate dependent enzyme n=1 Tax=Bradyrhizobium sp. 188 TaxID=2782656 RepID=UPI001FF7DD2D|nr:pyridoxal-phosphate dependent enzyme [Bradyrhizobium sp. 188]MCK1502148.1 pyridoxal-phosphate dependent enzyme [Bradyrhizobium sp. 188]